MDAIPPDLNGIDISMIY